MEGWGDLWGVPHAITELVAVETLRQREGQLVMVGKRVAWPHLKAAVHRAIGVALPGAGAVFGAVATPGR